MIPTLGFIGTGTITAAMVGGLGSPAKLAWPVLLSPRNAGVAARLAAEFDGVSVAPDNQTVADRSEIVVLAVRPQVAEAVLRQLRLRPGQKVISLIAGLDARRISEWTGADHPCRAIPLPFVAKGCGLTAVFPPDPVAMTLFDALGEALPVTNIVEFDAFASLSALMGSFFGIAGLAADWGGRAGLSPAQSGRYVAELFANLAGELRADPLAAERLRAEHSTRGGLNEQLFESFRTNGGEAALCGALDGVLQRIRAASERG